MDKSRLAANFSLSYLNRSIVILGRVANLVLRDRNLDLNARTI
jgi:hypothetical protein